MLSADAPLAVEYLPAPQLVQAADPVVVLYFPATQTVHTPASGPVYPALHTQVVGRDIADTCISRK
jgi:hypothetical protein